MSCVLSIILYLARKDTKKFAYMQINGEKVAIFWCKVYGVKCKGGNYSACTPRTEPKDGKYEKHLRVEPTVAMKIIRTKIIENLTKNYPKVAT